MCLKGKIIVNEGYWRRENTSTFITKCLSKNACLGEGKNLQGNQINCRIGYEGNLCSKCSLVLNSKYERVNEFE